MNADGKQVRVEVCERHGIRYNAAKDAGCVRCRKEWEARGGEPPMARPSTPPAVTPQPARTEAQGSSSVAPQADFAGSPESGSRDTAPAIDGGAPVALPDIYEGGLPGAADVYEGSPMGTPAPPAAPASADVQSARMAPLPPPDPRPARVPPAPASSALAPELADAIDAARPGFGPALVPAMILAVLLVLVAGSAAHLTHSAAYDAVNGGLDALQDGVASGEEGDISETDFERYIEALDDDLPPKILDPNEDPQ